MAKIIMQIILHYAWRLNPTNIYIYKATKILNFHLLCVAAAYMSNVFTQTLVGSLHA